MDKDVKIHNKSYTGYEYSQIKPQIFDKIEKREITFDEYNMWIDIANRECPKGMTFRMEGDKTIDNINNLLKDNKCK